MSFLNLDDLSYLSSAGDTLNIEEQTSLRSSLVTLQDAENFASVAFWGKILGVQQDYYIAQAFPTANLFKKKYFYSFDAVNWLQLPEIGPNELKLSEKINGRFTGDASFVYSVEQKTINEENRLAAVVQQIDQEVSIVPKGSYYRDAVGNIQVSPNFCGLSPAEIGYPENYQHFHPSFLLSSNSGSDTLSLFHPISKDEPKGIWSISLDKQGAVGVIRSNLWPGYLFFHLPAGNGPSHPSFNTASAAAAPLNTSNIGGTAVGGLASAFGAPSNGAKFGSWYYGTGLKNVNAAFML